MRRREFITLVGGAAAWPLPTRAQQSTMPVIGFFRSTSADDSTDLLAAFRRGLGESGLAEGHTVTIEYRWARGHFDQLPEIASELVRRKVAVIVANNNAARAAKFATRAVPIVFVSGSDPIKDSLVASLNRPGGNVTGITFLVNELGPKRLEVMHELIPQAATIGILVNPNSPAGQTEAKAVMVSAQTIGQQIEILNATDQNEIDKAFATLSQRRIAALLLIADALFYSQRNQLVALAGQYAIPTIHYLREFAAAGGLMSYGTSITDAYRRAGIYAGRIVKGESPADLPVEQSTKVELVINLKTAKTLGLTFPLSLLGRADEVIE